MLKKFALLIVFSHLVGCAVSNPVHSNFNHKPDESLSSNYQDRIVHRDLNEAYVPRPSDPELASIYADYAGQVKAEEEKTKRQQESLKQARVEKRLKAARERLKDVQEGKVDVSAATKRGNTVFEVRPGSLKDNAERLLSLFGWKLYRWESDNYAIDYAYSVEVKDLKAGLDFLLKPYPVQAKRIMANRTVLFVQTNKPKK